MKKRISPEDDKSIDWVPVDDTMLKDWYDAKQKRRAKREEPKFYDGWYGAVVKTRKKK
jgi:predicted nucleic acid-binding protein